ncbi:MAG: ATP-binding cassette domain-containing protein [Actinobacteria bacterium]|nr:ATP-binding cassette domain-containing protein [Actinomycetota bacterium]
MSEIARIGCVSHTYPDRTTVKICGLEFSVMEGEKVVILGPNGSGKTTLLQHLMGLLKPVEGEVRVFGVDPGKHFNDIIENYGVVFQHVEDQLVAPTVWDDITFGPRNFGYPEDKLESLANEIIERIGIADLKTKIPHYLSGGEKKKVALAGAMVAHPKLLILDEPFEGLDPKSKHDMLMLLNEFNRIYGTTIILTTHDINIVPVFADRAYVMVRGNIILSGAPQDVFTEAELLRSINLEPPLLTVLISGLRDRGVSIDYTNDQEKLLDEIVALTKKP